MKREEVENASIDNLISELDYPEWDGGDYALEKYEYTGEDITNEDVLNIFVGYFVK